MAEFPATATVRAGPPLLTRVVGRKTQDPHHGHLLCAGRGTGLRRGCRTGLTSWVPPGLPAAPEGWSHMEGPQQPQPLCPSPVPGPTRPLLMFLSAALTGPHGRSEGSEPRAPAQHRRAREHRQVVGSLRPSPGLQPPSLLGPHGAARLGRSRERLLCAAEPTAETTGSPRGLRGCGGHRRTGRPRDPQGVIQEGGLLPSTPHPHSARLWA